MGTEMVPIEKRAEDMRAALSTPRVQAQLAAALPSVGLTAQRFARMAMTAFTTNPDLYNCTKESVIRSLIVCAQLGLAPTGAFGAYLVPFKNKKGEKEATVICDYRGIIARSWRSNRLLRVTANVVREGEFFEYEEGGTPFLRHTPGMGKDKKPVPGASPVVFVYALAHLRDSNAPSFVVLTVEGVEWYRSKSKVPDSPMWRNDWNAAACKTALRRLFESGRMPMQDDDQRLVELLQGEDSGIDMPTLEKLSPEELAATRAADVESVTTTKDAMPDPNSPEGKALQRELDLEASKNAK